MLLKSCARCGALVRYGKSYCDRCAPIIEQINEERKQQSNKRYNKSRDRKFTAFYGSKEWQILSKECMSKNNYICQRCGSRSGQVINGIVTKLEVHHVVPIQTQEGWQRRFDFSNLICICHVCHNKEHNRF